MDFARLLEQAKDLWSRPIGKLLIGSIAVFLVGAAVLSYFWTRPTYVALGRFDAENAPKVQKALADAKMDYKPSSPDFTFMVRPTDLDKAKLLVASLGDVDPSGALWSQVTWKGQTSWSDTEFDKRQLWVDQTQTNLARAIRVLSVVDQAQVHITVPMDQKLFKDDIKPPKATVVVLPKKGQKLTTPVVEAIMELVASAVDGLDKTNVTVVDSSTSRVVSADAFKPKSTVDATGDGSNLQLTIEKAYQDRWQQQLQDQLERVAGAGNVSVIVNPSINWARVTEEVTNYQGGPNGKGIVLSESNKKSSSDGGGTAASATPSGATPNTEVNVPGYPSTPATGSQAISSDNVETIVNYLVNQTKTTTEKPGGMIDEIAVGVLVNSKTIDATAEQQIKNVVTTAMGSKAKVEVAALQFAPTAWDLAGGQITPPPTPPQSYNWLYVILAIALTMGAIGLGMLAFRPRKPVLEPVFAGPEAAMMGGIPVADLEMAAAIEAYGSQSGAIGQQTVEEKNGPQSAEDISALAPEEIALLGDEFLHQLGVDPAQVRMREKVEKIAKSNPEAVATLLKTWISDG